MIARLAGLLRRAAPLAALALSLWLASSAAACPSCKAALANQEGQGDLVAGFFWSILFMMSMPFALTASFGGYMYVLVRRARLASAVPSNAGDDADEV